MGEGCESERKRELATEREREREREEANKEAVVSKNIFKISKFN